MSIDQSAAFDSIDHDILMSKLQHYSLGQDCLQWIESYLRDRTSYVSIGSTISTMSPTKYGVPQGSVLGPTLYLLYVNEFPLAIKDDLCSDLTHNDPGKLFGGHCETCGSLPLYADNALYITRSSSRMINQVRIEENFQRLKTFLNINGLQINDTKMTLTEYMTRQKRGRLRGIPPELTVKETVKGKIVDKHITDVPYCRTLGVNVKNYLTWDTHLLTGNKAIIPAIRRQLGAMYSIKDKMSFTCHE